MSYCESCGCPSCVHIREERWRRELERPSEEVVKATKRVGRAIRKAFEKAREGERG